jgi:hypothetical protein
MTETETEDACAFYLHPDPAAHLDYGPDEGREARKAPCARCGLGWRAHYPLAYSTT